MTDKELGRLIKEARIKAGYKTQVEFALKLKTSKSAISAIENGKKGVCINTLRKIAKACNTTLRVFFD